MECAVCHKKEYSKTRCVLGHYVCNDCHTRGMDSILGLCTREASKDPVAIIEKMMDMPFCHMHGPEHHVMVGCALLTAYKNAGGEIDLHAALAEMMNRGKKVPSWGCSNRVVNKRAACDSHHVREDVLEATYIEAMREVMASSAEVTNAIRSSADAVMAAEGKARLQAIDDEILTIQAAALDLHKAKQRMEVGQAEYDARKKELQDAMYEKERERAALESSTLKYAEVRAWLKAFDESVNSCRILTANDAEIIRMIVDRIIVKDDGIEVCLKCGVSIGQEFIR